MHDYARQIRSCLLSKTVALCSKKIKRNKRNIEKSLSTFVSLWFKSLWFLAPTPKQQMLPVKTLFYYMYLLCICSVYLCVCVWVHACPGDCMEVKREFVAVSVHSGSCTLLLLCIQVVRLCGKSHLTRSLTFKSSISDL